MKNTEIKARLSETQRIALIHLLGSPDRQMKQVDTYYRVPNGRMKIREIFTVSVLTPLEHQLIIYQREDQKDPKMSDYTITPLTQYHCDDLKLRFAQMFGIKTIITKTRTLYRRGSLRIHLDQVQDLGYFVELESVEPDTMTSGQEEIRYWMNQLSIADEDLLTGSYSDLCV